MEILKSSTPVLWFIVYYCSRYRRKFSDKSHLFLILVCLLPMVSICEEYPLHLCTYFICLWSSLAGRPVAATEIQNKLQERNCMERFLHVHCDSVHKRLFNSYPKKTSSINVNFVKVILVSSGVPGIQKLLCFPHVYKYCELKMRVHLSNFTVIVLYRLH